MEYSLWNNGAAIITRPRRLMNKLFVILARNSFIHPKIRVLLHKLRGVNFIDSGTVFIGADVYIDELHPENITIGKTSA